MSEHPSPRIQVKAIVLIGSCIGVVLPLAVACTTSAPVDPKIINYVVSVRSAPFYKYGPAQAFGADMNLQSGQHVTMMTRQFGYSRVMLDDGVSGWVPTDDLKPAPATPVPKPSPPPVSAMPWANRPNPAPSKFKPSPDPLFDVNDVPPPPLPSKPEKKPTPAPGGSLQLTPLSPSPPASPGATPAPAGSSPTPNFRF